MIYWKNSQGASFLPARIPRGVCWIVIYFVPYHYHRHWVLYFLFSLLFTLFPTSLYQYNFTRISLICITLSVQSYLIKICWNLKSIIYISEIFLFTFAFWTLSFEFLLYLSPIIMMRNRIETGRETRRSGHCCRDHTCLLSLLYFSLVRLVVFWSFDQIRDLFSCRMTSSDM